MDYLPQYGMYEELCSKGKQTIKTEEINIQNIDSYFYSIINILKDGIETKEVQSMMLKVLFTDGIDVNLSIFDYVINVMFWNLPVGVNKPITSMNLVFFEDITKRSIKEFIDTTFVDVYRKEIPFIMMNNIIDSVIGKFRDLRPFQVYLANTLNLEDSIELMQKYPEFNDAVHFSTAGIPLEDVKDKGLEAANVQIKYIKNSNHCLRDSFRTGEAISPKQYKEVAVNIGTKPDGQGSVFPHPIEHSFMNGGLQTAEELTVESSVGRVAQILQKTNVGESGAFARSLELNNQDTFLNVDPFYVCKTRNFQRVTIENATMLGMFDLRYYRENPNGIDKLLKAKKDKHLIGKTLYFRSPMTCESAAHGHGICYKCYGDLAYANQEVNCGQIAAEGLSSVYTQILLSAKHLLESLVIKMTWTEQFYQLFNVDFNTISLKDEFNYKGFKMIINESLKTEDELDDTSYSYYINSFIVKDPSGNEFEIKTTDKDNIYFSQDFIDIVLSANAAAEVNNEEIIEFDMSKLAEIPTLFIMEIKNNELSRTMDKCKKLIDSKSVIEQYDRNSILMEFIKTNISGNIKLNSVHFEVILMNQIRAAGDELEKPDWGNINEPYQILTLSKSLLNNPSITVRLQNSKIPETLRNPRNRFIKQASISDLFFMEQPQEYLEKTIISDENKPKSDIERNYVEPISFKDPSIQVGRTTRKKKITKADIERKIVFIEDDDE